ncbi:hypothetical protein [Uliginosibacterium sp. H1]|uniref:hypothetical protein n=1 Tax=Uliginosibacterium sp. H1 TaxID=3114757 RepID=UPI002E18B7F0|nr:hypothetical protein [Uliginosibacterium sp. H1]
MDYTCPLCTADLKGQRLRKVPREGEFRFLALRWHLECPFCDGALMLNQHPSEKAAFPLVMLVVVAINGVAWLAGSRASGSVLLVVLAAMIVVPYVIIRFATPETWLRYVPWREVLV